MASCFRVHLEPVVFFAQVASAFFDTGLQMVAKQRCEDQNRTGTEEHSQQKALSDFYMTFNMLGKFMPIIPAAILLWLSDKGYRRMPIIVPLIGYATSRVLLVLVIAFDWPLKVMFAAPVVHGLCGGFSSYWAGVMALVSLNTNELKRSVRIMRTEFVYGLAGFLGSLSSGHLFQLYTVGIKQGVIMAISSVVLYFLCLVYVMFVLKLEEQSDSPDFRRENSIQVNRDNLNVALLFVSGILYDIAVTGGIEILNVFVLEDPLRWSATEVGYGNAAGSLIFITSFIGVKIFTWRSLSDSSMVIIGMLSFLSGIYFMSFVTSNVTFYLARSLMLFALIPVPTIRSLLSKQVQGSSYGTTFIILQLSFRIAGLATTPIYTKIYQSTLHFFPGFVFTISSIITFLAVIPISIVGYRTARQEQYEQI